MFASATASAPITDFSQSLQGMRRALEQLESAAKGVSAGDVSTSRMVDLAVGERMFEAGASVIRVQDAIVGSLLDVKR